jgi:hypothetical protein
MTDDEDKYPFIEVEDIRAGDVIREVYTGPVPAPGETHSSVDPGLLAGATAVEYVAGWDGHTKMRSRANAHFLVYRAEKYVSVPEAELRQILDAWERLEEYAEDYEINTITSNSNALSDFMFHTDEAFHKLKEAVKDV